MVRLGRSYPVQRIWTPPKKAAAAAGPAFDALGAGFLNLSGSATSGSWSHTAAAGSEVLVFVAAGVGAPTVQYGSSSMTQAATVTDAQSDIFCVFKLSGAPGGAQTVTVTASGGGGYVTAGNSISATGVTTVGTPATSSGSSSQSVSWTSGQLIVQSFEQVYVASVTGTGISAYSGGTGRYKDSSGGLSISTATASTTFTETDQGSGADGAAIAVVLS
jgi:hypothetical protein